MTCFHLEQLQLLHGLNLKDVCYPGLSITNILDCVWASASPDEQPWQPWRTAFGLTPSLSDPISRDEREHIWFQELPLWFWHQVGLKCRNIYRSLPLGGRMVRFQSFSLLFFQQTLYDQMFAKTKRWFQSSPTCENSQIRAHLKYIDDNVGFKVKPARLHFQLGRHFVTYLSPLSTSRM